MVQSNNLKQIFFGNCTWIENTDVIACMPAQQVQKVAAQQSPQVSPLNIKK
jgi:hypothetical protein